MGPPGGGKGTISKMVTRDFAIPQLSSGDLIRQQIRDETKVGLGRRCFGRLCFGRRRFAHVRTLKPRQDRVPMAS